MLTVRELTAGYGGRARAARSEFCSPRRGKRGAAGAQRQRQNNFTAGDLGRVAT